MTTLSRFMKPVILAGFAAILFAAAQPARAQETGGQTQTGPRLDFPAGLATDSRTVWVANSRNNTIGAIDTTSHSLRLWRAKPSGR